MKRTRMNLIIVISFLILAVLIFALIKLNRRRLPEARTIPAEIPQFAGLFAEQRAAEAESLEEKEARQRLLQSALQAASGGDLHALDQAHEMADALFYHEVLNRLVEQTGGNEKLVARLARYLVESGRLRSSAGFNKMLRERWHDSLDRQSLYFLFYLSALSDDGGDFLRAIETAMQQWRRGRLKVVSSEEFIAVIESCYWLIGSEIRASGSGFVIKQAIADVHRELAAATGSRLD